MFETNFIDNKYDGKHTEWYENGQIEREGFHENGKAVGWWRFWLEDGQIDYVKNSSSFNDREYSEDL
jgi:antitoxin component YwqK of YwqJK toxin-antitoxin module